MRVLRNKLNPQNVKAKIAQVLTIFMIGGLTVPLLKSKVAIGQTTAIEEVKLSLEKLKSILDKFGEKNEAERLEEINKVQGLVNLIVNGVTRHHDEIEAEAKRRVNSGHDAIAELLAELHPDKKTKIEKLNDADKKALAKDVGNLKEKFKTVMKSCLTRGTTTDITNCMQGTTSDANKTAVSWLFYQEAHTAVITKIDKTDNASVLQFNLEVKIDQVYNTIAFADRPSRQVYPMRIDEFVSLWNKNKAGNSFSKDPPNAVLSFKLDDERQGIVVEIMNVQKTRDNNLLIQIRLDKTIGCLGNNNRECVDIVRRTNDELNEVSLFIDALAPSGGGGCFGSWCPQPDPPFFLGPPPG